MKFTKKDKTMKLTKTQRIRLSRFRKGLILGGFRTRTLGVAIAIIRVVLNSSATAEEFLDDRELRAMHYVELGIFVARRTKDYPGSFIDKIAEIKRRKQAVPRVLPAFIGNLYSTIFQ